MAGLLRLFQSSNSSTEDPRFLAVVMAQLLGELGAQAQIKHETFPEPKPLDFSHPQNVPDMVTTALVQLSAGRALGPALPTCPSAGSHSVSLSMLSPCCDEFPFHEPSLLIPRQLLERSSPACCPKLLLQENSKTLRSSLSQPFLPRGRLGFSQSSSTVLT